MRPPGARVAGRVDKQWAAPRQAQSAQKIPRFFNSLDSAPVASPGILGYGPPPQRKVEGPAMLRDQLREALKQAMKAKDQRAVSTLRLILAALKDRDIAARGRGVTDGIGEPEIIEMMQKMVRQRHESIELYQRGGRPELAQQEADEIAIIEGYLPRQLDEAEAGAAVDAVVAELGATNLKDMGRVMAALKERFGGRMDFAKAGARVKQKLG
jgi:uncharacterized protein YqeY